MMARTRSKALYLTSLLTMVTLAVCLLSCNDEVNIPDGAFDEKIMDLSGLWTVGAVSLNEQDITDRLNFNDLTLKLETNTEGPTTYEVDNGGAPFIVTTNGTWQFDDNVYPKSIVFTSENGDDVVRFTIPPISRDNRFTIEFSLGCEDNVYVYQMIRQ